MQLRSLLKSRKGTLSDLSLGAVIAIVTLFVGLYMISKVNTIANLTDDANFGSVNQALISNTSTIYDVLILVIIIVALGVAIGVLRGMSARPGAAPGGAATV